MKTQPIIPSLAVGLTLFLASCGTEDLDNQISELKDEVKKLEKSESELKLKNTELQDQVAAAAPLKEQLATATHQLKGAQEEADITFKQKEDLQKELDAANEQVETLQNQLASAATATPAPVAPAQVTPAPVTPAPVTPAPTAPVASFPTTPTPPAPVGNPLAIPTTPAPATPTPNPVLIPTTPAPPVATLSTGANASITVSVQLTVQGKTYNLPNCEVYITEQRPDVSKWGLYLKNPQVSHNNLQQIKASLNSSIIHKKGQTDANGQVSFTDLEANTYFISTAHDATQRGLQWSVQHQVKPGQNVLVLSAKNRTP